MLAELSKLIIDATIFVFPAFVANAAPTILGKGTRFNAPIDGGRLWRDNKRILGDGKTIRGFISGVTCGMIACVTILIVANQISYPVAFLTLVRNSVIYSIMQPIVPGFLQNEIIVGSLIGFLLGCGALIGDIIGSFIKRRSGLKRGESYIFMDQLGFLVTAFVMAYIVVPWPFSWILLLLPITLVLHISLNLVSYNIGLQKAPL
jgi:CDP-2,3-bis-(O-geranylgeranyl)-sn-glycerol synthase